MFIILTRKILKESIMFLILCLKHKIAIVDVLINLVSLVHEF